MTGSQNVPVASGLQTRDGRVGKTSRSRTVPTGTGPNAASAESERSGPEITLLSPVTPGSTLSPTAPLQTTEVTVANKTSDPPPAALPSPVPSTDSHPSPVVSHNVPAGISDTGPCAPDNPATVAQPVDSYTATSSQLLNQSGNGQDQRQNTAVTTAALSSEPVLSSELRTSAPIQSPSYVATVRDAVPSPVARQIPYQSPLGASPALSHLQVNEPANERLHPPLEDQNPRVQSPRLKLPDEQTWKWWKASFKLLQAKTRHFPTASIVGGRVQLLGEALEKRDLFFLVLHLVYCLRAVDGRVLTEFPVLQDEPCLMGMDKLSELIAGNATIPTEYAWCFASFPFRLEDLKHEAWLLKKIDQISQWFRSISTDWLRNRGQIIQGLCARGYPPLTEELRRDYNVGSPVLLGVIFRSICRDLYSDDKVPQLNRLFQRDLTSTALFMEARRENRQQQQLDMKQRMADVVDEYRKIPMILARRPRVPNSDQPALPGSQSQAMRSHATGLPSVDGQPSASPTIPTSADTTVTSTSPQVMMVQTPGYFQHPYMHSSQPQLQPQMQQMQVQQGQQHQHQQPQQYQQHQIYQLQQQQQMQPQQQWQAMQRSSFYPALPPQGPSPLSLHPASLPQRPPQPAYAVQSAHRGQEHHVLRAQGHPSIPLSTQAVVSTQIAPPYRQAQVVQQQDPQPSNSPTVNMSAQRRASQRPPLQSPHAQFGQQTVVPPRQVPSPAMQGPSAPYPSPRGPLLPPAEYRVPITVGPNPMRLGLHQADLRDPVKKLFQKGPQGEWVETELYHFQADFLLTPQIIDLDALSYNWTFTLSEEDYHRFPHLQDLGQGQRPIRTFQPGCRSFRLRSIALSDPQKKDLERLWSTRVTTWPSVFYIHVNGVEMFVRRKVHNGKDLPLDITKHLKLGENKVHVHFLLGAQECEKFKYFFGIERMLTTKFEDVLNMVGTTPAEETRQLIHDRLTPSVSDDDVAFITDNLTISLVDPFTAQILKVPVRSINCTHLECFDLETFIGTRKSESGPAPFRDNWRCPICDADARPRCLRVDRFLVEILDELTRTHRLEAAQAIQVKADGAWTLKAVHDDSLTSPHPSRAASLVTKRKADSTPDTGPEATRPKSENPSNRESSVHLQERLVIELD